ncbi:hypothetical protein HGRIS_009396 [Hohenbuehelia grisea]|uniref:Uncharacterized protein n=1 Tax=Hohenbuehelia grisea TaxID=104357 RepID=A0ABR3J111_9AGAR
MSVFLAQIQPEYALLCSVFNHLDARSLVRYSQVDRSAYAAYCSYALQTFHPRHVLCPYFDSLNIHPFFQVQEATGMLISGSSALQLLDRTDYPASDLDLDVELPHGDLAVAWLISRGCIMWKLSSDEELPALWCVSQLRSLEPRRGDWGGGCGAPW